MIRLYTENERLAVEVDVRDLEPRHESQLAYWGFVFDPARKRFLSPEGTANILTSKVANYFNRCGRTLEMAPAAKTLLEEQETARRCLILALDKGMQLKNGSLDISHSQQFQLFLNDHVPRRLKPHQLKAALHLLEVENAANFSVPGSGKTSVVLSVYHRLRHLGDVDSLFVVGPPSCFGPWRIEYEQTLGAVPTYQIMAGGDVEERQSKYLVNKESVCDLYLTSFQTLQRDWRQVQILFERQGLRFFFVVDEAHYIKQLGGAWATAALNVARSASRRCILTGTPFPRSYVDAFNLFDALWPASPPISPGKKHKIQLLVHRNQATQASQLVRDSVGPLFYRVRKKDLGLAPQEFKEPTQIPMNKFERRVYDSILGRIQEVSQAEYFRDLDLMLRLRRGRMIRLRQCLSYTALLG